MARTANHEPTPLSARRAAPLLGLVGGGLGGCRRDLGERRGLAPPSARS